MNARIAMNLFHYREVRQRRVAFRAVPALGPRLCAFHEFTPVICPPSGAGKELIDALLCGLVVVGHVSLSRLCEVDGLSNRAPLLPRSLDSSQWSHSLATNSRQPTANAELRDAIGRQGYLAGAYFQWSLRSYLA